MPNVWQAEYDDVDQCHVLYNPSGAGDLQISTMVHDQNLTVTDLNNLAEEHIQAGAKPGQVELGDFTGIVFEYDVENEYWSEWYLAADNLLLFATYTCMLEKEGKDAEDVELIMGTLKSIIAQ